MINNISDIKIGHSYLLSVKNKEVFKDHFVYQITHQNGNTRPEYKPTIVLLILGIQSTWGQEWLDAYTDLSKYDGKNPWIYCKDIDKNDLKTTYYSFKQMFIPGSMNNQIEIQQPIKSRFDLIYL